MKGRAAPPIQPVGRRGKRGSGRVRTCDLSIKIHQADDLLLDSVCARYGMTRTEVVEAGIRLIAAQGPPKAEASDT